MDIQRDDFDNELEMAQRHTANDAALKLDAVCNGIRQDDPVHTRQMIAALRKHLDTLEALALLAEEVKLQNKQTARREMRGQFYAVHPLAV